MPHMGLDKLELLLAIIGGVSIIISPFVHAWLTLRVHKAIETAPAFVQLQGRVKANETWQEEHADDVKLIPRLAAVMERVETALEKLTEAFERSGRE
jgi:hypothetical protein